MALEITEETTAQVLANARGSGLAVDDYLRRLMLDAEERNDFVCAVEAGLSDVEAGLVRPAREALGELGTKLGFSS